MFRCPCCLLARLVATEVRGPHSMMLVSRNTCGERWYIADGEAARASAGRWCDACLHALSSTGKLYSDRYLHMHALICLIIYIVAPASAGRESFHAPSNRGSAFQALSKLSQILSARGTSAGPTNVPF
jgi:hypothetical protein